VSRCLCQGWTVTIRCARLGEPIAEKTSSASAAGGSPSVPVAKCHKGSKEHSSASPVFKSCRSRKGDVDRTKDWPKTLVVCRVLLMQVADADLSVCACACVLCFQTMQKSVPRYGPGCVSPENCRRRGRKNTFFFSRISMSVDRMIDVGVLDPGQRYGM